MARWSLKLKDLTSVEIVGVQNPLTGGQEFPLFFGQGPVIKDQKLYACCFPSSLACSD